MCFTIDYRILHVKIAPEATRDATHFYTLFYNAPPAIKVGDGSPLFVVDISLMNDLKGFPSLDDGNRYYLFVGKTSQVGRERDLVRWILPRYEHISTGSIAAPTDGLCTAVFVFAIAVYLTVTIPALRAVVNPAEADSEFTFDQSLGLLGAGNTIIAGLLALILVMQARCTIVNRAASETECFSCSGWARVREARRSKGISRRGEGKDQGDQVGVNGYWVNFPYSCIPIVSLLSSFTTLFNTLMHSRSDPVQRLLSWCSLKRIHIDNRLSVIQDETTGEISVLNLTEETIPVSQTREYPDYVRGWSVF